VGAVTAERREVVVAGALVRHQVRQYLRALNIEWVEDQSLTGDRVRFEFEATDVQWSDVQAWVEKVTG
jgi:hypothetical protein